MDWDVRLFAVFLLLQLAAAAADFGLEFSVDPVKQSIVPPGSVVQLHCSTNLPLDTITWHLNHHPLPQQLITNNALSNQHRSHTNRKYNYQDNYAASHEAEKDLSAPTDERESYFITSYSNGTSFLTIHLGTDPESYANQLGIYQCIATLGSISLASAPSRLDVATMEPYTGVVSSREAVVVTGGAVRVPCSRPLSRPPAVLSYHRDGELLYTQGGGSKGLFTSPSGELLLVGVTAGGVYTCTATNTVLQRTLRHPVITTVTVLDNSLQGQEPSAAPTVQLVGPTPGLVIVTEGQDVMLPCVVNSRPGSTATWWSAAGGDSHQHNTNHLNSLTPQLSENRYTEQDALLQDTDGHAAMFVDNDVLTATRNTVNDGALLPADGWGSHEDDPFVLEDGALSVDNDALSINDDAVSSDYSSLSDEDGTVAADSWSSYRPSAAAPAEGLMLNSSQPAVLSLSNVSSSDSGSYTCHAQATPSPLDGPPSPQLGALLTASVQLYVEAAPVVVQGLTSASLHEGQRLELRCSMTGRPPPLLYWLSNGRLLVPARHTITAVPGSSVLVLDSVKKHHAGVVQCFGHNAAGSASSHAFYTVTPASVQGGGQRGPGNATETNASSRDEGRRHRSQQHRHKNKGVGTTPSRPLVTRVADDTAQLTWTPPPQHQHQLLFYKVQYRELASKSRSSTERPTSVLPGLQQYTGSSSSQWRTDDTTIPAGHNTSLVTGLTPGNTYKFRVAAVYADQENRLSSASARFTMTRRPPLQPPSAPPHLLWVRWTSGGGVMLAWRYSGDDTETDGFTVGYRPAGSSQPYSKLRFLGSSRRSVQVTEPALLQPPYQFRLQAFNMAGSSRPSRSLTLPQHGVDASSPPSVANQRVIHSSPDPSIAGVLRQESMRGAASELQAAGCQPATRNCRRAGTSKPSAAYNDRDDDDSLEDDSDEDEYYPGGYGRKHSSSRNYGAAVYNRGVAGVGRHYDEYGDYGSNNENNDDLRSDDTAGGSQPLSSMHLLVLLVCVLLGLVALVLGSYVCYTRRERNNATYCVPLEQLSDTTTAEGNSCLQALGAPEPSARCGLVCQPHCQHSPLTLPD